VSAGHKLGNADDPITADSSGDPDQTVADHTAGPVRRVSTAEGEMLEEAKPRSANYKIGIDANRPIDPRTGRIQPQVADPGVIASTGTGWVRLNFVLGPWSSPNSDTLYEGRTWAQAYGQIISGFRDRGLNVYGLIGVEAMPKGPGDRFREPPPHGTVSDQWLEQYVESFSTIVEMFHDDVQAFESFNEPDDWHGQNRNWVHPGWFAIMLQRIYEAVRSKPELERVKLVSGPLQGLEANRNVAVHYLQNTYRTGKAWFGWGRAGIAVPFDGVGYHIYVQTNFDPDREGQEHAVRTTCRRYLHAMHQVIRQEEGQDRPLYVSEMGWNSRIDRQEIQRREEFQARCLQAGLETVYTDPLVELGVWFCTQDFGTRTSNMFFGLYRPGKLTPEQRKPAFHTFKAFCEGVVEEDDEEEEKEQDRKPVQYTNQHVINAFYRAAVEMGLSKCWGLLTKAGLRLGRLAADRQGIYDGPPIDQLSKLTVAEKTEVQAQLNAQVSPGQADSVALVAAGSLLGSELPFESPRNGDLGLDLVLALQDQILQELERNNELLEGVLEKIEGSDLPDDGTKPILSRVRELLQ
jgi:hypothetical protein